MADVKGDLTGIAQAGTASEKLLARLKNIGVNDWQPHANPVVVWDIFGEKGHPVRATVSDLGPLLLAAAVESQRCAIWRAEYHFPHC
ncbi:ATPase [Escherichia coli]|uniref:ATPase n=1 Tax=Escherichia coli TaxID=562 RepID=A0A376LH72_ECOLX|nr:ATPase [Escherichia coli]